MCHCIYICCSLPATPNSKQTAKVPKHSNPATYLHSCTAAVLLLNSTCTAQVRTQSKHTNHMYDSTAAAPVLSQELLQSPVRSRTCIRTGLDASHLYDCIWHPLQLLCLISNELLEPVRTAVGGVVTMRPGRWGRLFPCSKIKIAAAWRCNTCHDTTLSFHAAYS